MTRIQRALGLILCLFFMPPLHAAKRSARSVIQTGVDLCERLLHEEVVPANYEQVRAGINGPFDNSLKTRMVRCQEITQCLQELLTYLHTHAVEARLIREHLAALQPPQELQAVPRRIGDEQNWRHSKANQTRAAYLDSLRAFKQAVENVPLPGTALVASDGSRASDEQPASSSSVKMKVLKIVVAIVVLEFLYQWYQGEPGESWLGKGYAAVCRLFGMHTKEPPKDEAAPPSIDECLKMADQLLQNGNASTDEQEGEDLVENA